MTSPAALLTGQRYEEAGFESIGTNASNQADELQTRTHARSEPMVILDGLWARQMVGRH